MLKYSFLKSTKILNMVLILILFSSCAVSKYDYYYTILKSDIDSSSIEKSTHFYTANIINNNDSVHLEIAFLNNRLVLGFSVKNTTPVFFDYAESQIDINETTHKIAKNKVNLKDTLSSKEVLFSEFIGYLDYYNSDFIDLYKNYDDNQYANYFHDIGDEKINKFRDTYVMNSSKYKKLCHSNLLCKEFTREDTPVKIGIKMVYYTDSLFLDPKTINLNFYQAGLMKIKDMRYEGGREGSIYYLGETIGRSIKDITFFTKVQNGTIRGWPEIRYILGRATTILLLPILYPLYLLNKD